MGNEHDPRRFLEWDVIRKVMFVTNAVYNITEYIYLRKKKSWKKRWKHAIKEAIIESPMPFWMFPRSSNKTEYIMLVI